jgi:hypothetical protein
MTNFVNNLNAFDAETKRLESLVSGNGPMTKLLQRFQKIERLRPIVRAIHQKVVQAISPTIRTALDVGFRSSGIQSHTGELYRVAVTVWMRTLFRLNC